METQRNRDIVRLFGRKEPARLSNPIFRDLNGEQKIEPANIQNFLPQDQLYPDAQHIEQLPADLAADLSPRTVCSSHMEQLWLASLVSPS